MNHSTVSSGIEIRSDNRFGQVPHWVTESPISDGAYRLYAVLLKYADNQSKDAYPSRVTLAKALRKSSVRTVDKFVAELKAAGMVKVINRKRAGSKQNYTNLYYVITANPHANDELQAVADAEGWEIADAGDPVQKIAPPPAENCAENYTQVNYTQPSFTSDQRSEELVAPSPGGRGLSKGQLADPIGPEFHASQDRKLLVSIIKGAATARSRGATDAAEDLEWKFEETAEQVLGGDGAIGYMMLDHMQKPYRIKNTHANGKAAGKWLNQLINDARTEAGAQFKWRGQAHDLAA